MWIPIKVIRFSVKHSLRFQNKSFRFDFEAYFLTCYSNSTLELHFRIGIRIRIGSLQILCLLEFKIEAWLPNFCSNLNSKRCFRIKFEFKFDTLFQTYYLNLNWKFHFQVPYSIEKYMDWKSIVLLYYS